MDRSALVGRQRMCWAVFLPLLATPVAAGAGTFTDAVVAAQLKALAQMTPPPLPAVESPPPVDPAPVPGTQDVTIDQVVDLGGALRDYALGDYLLKEYSFAEPMLVQAGDSVDLTVRFSGTQALQMSDLGLGSGSSLYAWMAQDSLFDAPNSSNFTIANAYVDLLGTDGSVIRTIYVGTQSNGASHLGPDVNGLLYAGETLTITGYHAYFEVVALENGVGHYRGPWVYVQADQLQIVPVPEASTYAMMLAGLGLVAGASLRRRRAKGALGPAYSIPSRSSR